MRLNKFIAQATGISRREADDLISAGKVTVNDKPAQLGAPIDEDDQVNLDGNRLALPDNYTYLLVNKPTGYVSTRSSQDETPTVYELIPEKYHRLKYVGRLDKDSSGALLLTDDGDFAHRMTHPRYEKTKIYDVVLSSPLSKQHLDQIESGIKLEDGTSRLHVLESNDNNMTLEMHEGRNRQIRRTFEALGYQVKKLHRTKFGSYELCDIKSGEFIEVKKLEV